MYKGCNHFLLARTSTKKKRSGGKCLISDSGNEKRAKLAAIIIRPPIELQTTPGGWYSTFCVVPGF